MPTPPRKHHTITIDVQDGTATATVTNVLTGEQIEYSDDVREWRGSTTPRSDMLEDFFSQVRDTFDAL